MPPKTLCILEKKGFLKGSLMIQGSWVYEGFWEPFPNANLPFFLEKDKLKKLLCSFVSEVSLLLSKWKKWNSSENISST